MLNTPIQDRARRIYAILCRYFFLYKKSWPRLIEIAYWPTMQILVWGLVTTYLVGIDMERSSNFFFSMLAGALLWEIFLRTQIANSFLFLEEMWSRNLGHLFISPLRPYEWIFALMSLSLIRMTLGLIPPIIVSILLYKFSLFSLGFPLILFVLNLFLMGWWLGLIVQSLIIRYGLGIEALAWTISASLAPLSCVFYPVQALPEWLHPICHLLPTFYCFEAMRMILIDNTVQWNYLLYAFGLNTLYLIATIVLFMYFFKKAKDNAALIQMGE